MEAEVKRAELIDAIRENRNKHNAIFEEALEGYKKEVVAMLEQMLAAAREGKRVSHHIGLVQPINHLEDYDRILQLLGMSEDEFITIEELDFARYVRDQWEWKSNFLAANRTYSAGARSESDTLPGAHSY